MQKVRETAPPSSAIQLFSGIDASASARAGAGVGAGADLAAKKIAVLMNILIALVRRAVTMFCNVSP